jgi:hypothetical protein
VAGDAHDRHRAARHILARIPRRPGVGSVRLTPTGAVLLTLLLVALALALVGPGRAQAPALVGAALILCVIVGGMSGGSFGVSTKSLEDRRAEFHPLSRDPRDEHADHLAEAQAWEAERERYRERQGRP